MYSDEKSGVLCRFQRCTVHIWLGGVHSSVSYMQRPAVLSNISIRDVLAVYEIFVTDLLGKQELHDFALDKVGRDSINIFFVETPQAPKIFTSNLLSSKRKVSYKTKHKLLRLDVAKCKKSVHKGTTTFINSVSTIFLVSSPQSSFLAKAFRISSMVLPSSS